MVRLGRQLTKNVLASWVSYATRIGITFFFVPYITTVLGDARYGVWVILFQIIGYLSLLDFGLERALTRYLSKFLGQVNFPAINRVLSTSTRLYIVIGSAVIIAAWLISEYLLGYFKIADPLLAEEGRSALLIIGLYAGCRFCLLPFGGSLASFQRADIANGLGIAEDILRTLVMVWFLSIGCGLQTLAVIILAGALVRQIAGMIWLKALHPEVKLSLAGFDRETSRNLFSYSKTSFGITLGWLVIFGSDSILLGLLASSAAAGVYAPAAQLMLYLRHIIAGIGNPLTPAVSHLEAVGSRQAISDLYLKALRYLSFVSFFIATGVVVYAADFVRLWLEPEFFEASRVMLVLAVGSAVFLPQIIGNSILFGIEQHRYLLRVLMIEAILKLVLSIVLMRYFGLLGIALGNTIPQVFLYTTLYPYYLARVLSLPLGSAVWTGLRTGIPAAAITAPAALLLRLWINPTSWLTFGLNVVLVTALAGVVFRLILKREDRDLLRSYLTGSYDT